MLNAKAFAHAATVVTTVFYLACWLVSVTAPDLIFAIAKSWFHSINIESLQASIPMPLETVILGLITISALTWMTTYATIWLYNQWAKK